LRDEPEPGAAAPPAASPGSAPPRRPLARVRRPRILATAVELLREQGLWSVRLSDVAQRAGTSATGIVYYFGTKEELFKAAIADADAEFYAGLWPELDRLASGVERMALLAVRSSVSEWVLWMDLWVYARRHPELLPAQRAFADRWCATIAAVVRHGQARGEFDAVADAEAVAVRLGALTSGLAVRVVLDDPGRTPAHYVEMTLAAAATELGCGLALLRDAAAAAGNAMTPQPRAGETGR
jgi:AcrR family transcriptional regulator